jgi:hypothetical protein
VKRIRLPIAGRWLTFAETKRLQLIATKQERDAFLQSLAKTLRKRRKKPGRRKRGTSFRKAGPTPSSSPLIETDEQLEARLWK